MKAPNHVCVGIKGSVVALDRLTGEIVWQTKLKGSDFVNVVGEGGEVLAVTVGEVFCLDLASGVIKWHNPLKGWGTGLASLLVPGATDSAQASLLAKLRRDQEAAAAAAANSASTAS